MSAGVSTLSDHGQFRRQACTRPWLGRLAPAHIAGGSLEAAYIAESDRIVDSYRKSQDSRTEHFDWPRAQTVLEHAFDIHPRWADKVSGKTVLLVDDVLTTGATVEACARILQRGGSRHVDVLTLARVVRPAI